MSYHIQLQPGGQTFTAGDDHTLLEAALAAGLALPCGCRTGVCGACKARITQGSVDPGVYAAHALPEAERAEGYALLCRARARSDLTIEIPTAAQTVAAPVKQIPCRVSHLERLAEDVMRVDLQLPATESFTFRAGQYIDILLPDGGRRSFSIANAPCREGSLELHIRRVPGGRFTGHVFESMKARDILRIEGPHGDFRLREDSGRPIVMIGGGTGFAPLKGLVEHAIHIGLERPIAFYWGARSPEGLYLHEMAQSWHAMLPGLRYIPAISGNQADDGWTGRRGRVHEAVLADFDDLSRHEVYACGAPPMIEAARECFTRERGLPAEAFYADVFTFAAVPPPEETR
ncbi:MAG: CDP-6-deoxy-delta-3,4-glucoseen reductase [Azoarcus sp.]|jgi:CDP-4-dehydro-6-deoxyglucose reductase|nr:CDP-6-deoxy-delta-3,4-glucoseen reductase [Azoarcus sp.]